MTTVAQPTGTKSDGNQLLAERLLDADIPVIICTPNPRYGEPGQPELFPPSGWNTITVEQARADFEAYRPGVDTLAMVAGHGIDVLDIDTKVAGVKLEDVPHGIDMDNGITVTPSQGFHIPVRSTGYSSGSLYFNGKYVGDYCGGTKAGGGRKLVYLPGSHRPKYPDNVYVMAKDWDIDKILDSFVDDLLVTCLEACPGLSDTGYAGQPMAERHDIDAFYAEHSEVADCKYGQTAIYGDSLLGTPGLLDQTPDFGDQDNGLHAWITRTVNRATELVKSGCLDASVYSDIEQRVKELAKQHHEPNRYRLKEVTDCLAWAIPNVSEQSGCRKHDPTAKLPTVTAVDDDLLWKSRPLLAHIEAAAHSRGMSKWAVLATVLARFSCEIRPYITLPPTVGTSVSLNLFVALASPSGGGKSSAMGVADDLYNWGAPQRSVGSGEGLAQAYGSFDTAQDRWVQRNESLFLSVDEVSGLEALSARSGSTLLSYLLTAYTGGQISAAYSDKKKRFVLEKQSYRMSIVVGVQFAKADALFGHSDAGVPQRFVWASLIDPTIPVPGQKPQWPGQLTIPLRPYTGSTPVDMTIPDEVKLKIEWEAWGRNSGTKQTDGSADHRNLTQLKIAGLLALLDNRMDVSMEDWGLAGKISDASDGVQAEARSVLSQAAERELERKATGQAKVAAIAAEFHASTTAKRIAQRIAKHVWAEHDDGTYCIKKCIRKHLASDERMYYDDAIGVALEMEWLRAESTPRAQHLYPGAIQP